MRQSLLQLAKQPGLLKRSLEQLQLETRRVIKGSYLRGEYDDLPILTINDPSVRETITTMSDAATGGYSKVFFDIVDNRPKDVATKAPESEIPAIMDKDQKHITVTANPLVYGVFHGNISTKLPKHRPEIERSGYAGWRTLDRKRTIFLTKFIDIDPFKYLAFRVKSDGRKYFVNLQSDSIYETDIHQHRLFTRTVGEWETVVLDAEEFVRTNYGRRLDQQHKIMLQKVKTVGFSVIDRVEGPFEIAVEKIWATNNRPDNTSTGPMMSKDLEWE